MPEGNPGLDIVLTVVILILLALGTYFLAKKVIKEIKIARDEKSLHIEGLISKSDINSVINAYISRVSKGTNFSLIYIDLDKFEDLSEAFGTREAHKILESIAKRFKKILPVSSKIARYQGDEFLIFLNNQYNQKQVAEYAYKILYELRNKTKVQSAEIDLTGSIAVAHFPLHGNSLKRLLESLKIAIYQAKKLGGNTLKIYSDEFNQDSETIEYFYQIKYAIEKREFQLYYQPMIDYKAHNVYAYEALLRWNHPTLGVLSPQKFINIMEQTGDIHWVGKWGLECIIRAQHELEAISSEYKHIKFSINLSPKQLLSDTISVEFAKIIRKLKGKPENIILEINEFALFEKQEQIFDNLVKLSKIGFSIAVDGFSIDLATIGRLEKINVDIIKLRYQKIDEADSVEKRFMEMLLKYAMENQKIIICEGVESKQDLEQMLVHGINIFQGYYFTPPITFIEIQDYTESFLEKKNIPN